MSRTIAIPGLVNTLEFLGHGSVDEIGLVAFQILRPHLAFLTWTAVHHHYREQKIKTTSVSTLLLGQLSEGLPKRTMRSRGPYVR